MPAQDATSSGTRRRWFITVLLAMVLLAVMAGVVLSRLRTAEAGSSPATGTSTQPAIDATSAVPVISAAVPSADATGATTHTSKTTPTHKATTPASTTPVIVYFRVATEPSCPSGTDQVKYEGQEVVLEWKVTGADRASLAVDGPGLYDEYDAKGSATINFPCSGDPGSYQKHTYTLTATGPDGTKSKTLTVKAKVNEITTT